MIKVDLLSVATHQSHTSIIDHSSPNISILLDIGEHTILPCICPAYDNSSISQSLDPFCKDFLMEASDDFHKCLATLWPYKRGDPINCGSLQDLA